LAAPNLIRYVNNASQTWSGATVATDGGTGYLLAGIATAVQASAKHRQLNTHLVDLRRRLRSRLLRLHFSNDPSQIAEWRRQLAIVAQGRLQRVALIDRMHVLQLGLSVTEHELKVLYSGADTSNRSAVAATGTGKRRDAADCERLAAATVEYWLQSIRQVARSPRFCRSVGVAQPVLHHIIDEISIGAVRLGIAAQLTEIFHRSAHAPTGQPLSEAYFAVAAAKLIGSYIERLTLGGDGYPGGSSVSNQRARGRITSEPVLATTEARDVALIGTRNWTETTSGPRDPARRESARDWAGDWARDWAEAYGALVEANIAAAAHLTGGADRDRELGELLAGFLANPLEVDP
jgi:hypothetical protein